MKEMADYRREMTDHLLVLKEQSEISRKLGGAIVNEYLQDFRVANAEKEDIKAQKKLQQATKNMKKKLGAAFASKLKSQMKTQSKKTVSKPKKKSEVR